MKLDALLSNGWEALRQADWLAAQGCFTAVLRQTDEPAAHDGLGIALWWLNEVEKAHEQRTAAYLGYKNRGNQPQAAMIAMWLAREQVFLRANVSAMKGWFARASRLLADHPSSIEQAWLAIFQASMHAPPAELLTVAQHTMAVAQKRHHSELEIFSLAFAGLAYVSLGQIEAGMAAIDEAMVAATSGEIVSLMITSEVFCITLSACELAGDLQRTHHWCQVAVDFAQRYRCPFLSAYCRTTYGGLLTATGQWQEAETALLEAIRQFEAGHRALRVHALLRLADLRVCQGRLEEAELLLAGAEDYGNAVLPLARLHLARGEAALAQAVLEQALGRANPPTLDAVPLLRLLVDVLIALRDMEGARRTVGVLTAVAAQSQSPFLLAQAELAQGQFSLFAGEKEALDWFQAALNRLHYYEQSLLAGQVKLAMAHALRESDRAGAITWARAALACFERIGARHSADETLGLLREMGEMIRPAERSTELLTKREAEVLALLAHGLTNREIAERLVISAKTVEHHVSQLLGKLGVRSRAEAAAYAVRMQARGEEK